METRGVSRHAVCCTSAERDRCCSLRQVWVVCGDCAIIENVPEYREAHFLAQVRRKTKAAWSFQSVIIDPMLVGFQAARTRKFIIAWCTDSRPNLNKRFGTGCDVQPVRTSITAARALDREWKRLHAGAAARACVSSVVSEFLHGPRRPTVPKPKTL